MKKGKRDSFPFFIIIFLRRNRLLFPDSIIGSNIIGSTDNRLAQLFFWGRFVVEALQQLRHP
ncbi:MAG: hypothetical protein IJM81_05790 [Prevotella sp.]|nr:hypothetical protein [Prevotella sp.]